MATRTKRTTPTRSDAISLLKKDHATVKQLLNRMEKTTEKASARREQLLKEIENEIKIHTRIEEELFYPAFKEAARKADVHLYWEALEEHHVVDMVMSEAKGTDVESEEFGAKAKVIKDLIEHHAEEEETQMFPKARRIMSATELRDLGNRLQERKKELQAGVLTRVAVTAGSTLGRVFNRGRNRAA
jgi:hemerythrin-like domain-containing protein